MIKFIDYINDICLPTFIICLGIAAIIFTINIGESISKYDEQECVKFYNDNNYILNGCEIYSDKLERINE